ncbi:MAG: GAF domain-containing sensor histidine kinase [Dehalococcoidia bacterium]
MGSRRQRLVTVLAPIAFVVGLVLIGRFVFEPLLPAPVDLLFQIAVATAGIVAFNVFLTRRLDAAQQRVVHQNRQLAALDEASVVIASELSLDRVLQRIVDIVRELSGARYAALGVLGPDGVLTDLITSGLSGDERSAIGPMPINHGILGLMLRDGRPVRLSDVASEPHRTGFPTYHPRMTTLMGVPIVSGSRTIGNLYLADKVDDGAFTDDDERLIVLLAAHASVAIENARLHEQEQRLVAVQERNRIARELHDGTIQSIYGVNLLLEDVQDLIGDEPERARSRIDDAIDRLTGVIEELRGYIYNLRSQLHPGSLPELIADLVAHHRRTGVVDVQFSVQGQLADDRDVSWQLVQLVREALSNIARHAEASKVWVQLVGNRDEVVLEIADDGQGFDPEDTRPGGQGLRNMRDRAAALGGTFELDTEPGGGTRLTVRVPVAQGVRS